MKRIAIITMPKTVSFGASLQTYALQRYLNQSGLSTFVLNYLSKKIWESKKSKMRNPLRYCFSNLILLLIHSRFANFEKRIPFYPKVQVGIEQLASLSTEFDAVICGSDQVWNTAITGNDYSMFLDFCPPSVKRISYAPSFGDHTLERETEVKITNLLCSFDSLSVRETSGKDLIQSLCGKNAQVVLDPTFLVDAESWRSIEKPKRSVKSDYIFMFMINYSDRMERFAQKLSLDTGLPIIRIGGKFFENHKYCKNNLRLIGPDEWLYLLDHSQYVITNSFHGIAFSIIFHRQFYTEYSAITNDRLKEIVQKSGLEDRLISNALIDFSQAIDYHSVQLRIDSLIVDSKQFLQEALAE